jgi:hypothetical protein
MAKHLAEGRAFPVFFYGQTYGLSIVEAGAGAGAFLIAGVAQVPLKLAMLALWILGVVAFYFALARAVGRSWSFWAAVWLIVLPAWAVWSMKARGGYLTAFSATALLVLLLARLRERPGLLLWVGAGLLSALIFLAQRLWLPGVMPLLVAAWWRDRRLRSGLAWLGGAAVTMTGALASSGLTVREVVIGPSRGPGRPDLLGSLPDLVSRLYANFTGSYYLWMEIPSGPITTFLAWLSFGLLASLLVLQVYRLATGRLLVLSHLLCLSVLATIGSIWLLVLAPEPRFFLPVQALLLAWAAVEAADLVPRLRWPEWMMPALVGSVVALGALSQIEFRDYSYLWDAPVAAGSEAGWLHETIARLDAAGVRHVFVTNGLLQWQLLFYSGERVTARFTADRDRYPAYVAEVDRALEAGEPVAVVGYARARRNLERLVDPAAVITIGDRYYVYLGPGADLLRTLGFRFLADRSR